MNLYDGFFALGIACCSTSIVGVIVAACAEFSRRWVLGFVGMFLLGVFLWGTFVPA